MSKLVRLEDAQQAVLGVLALPVPGFMDQIYEAEAFRFPVLYHPIPTNPYQLVVWSNPVLKALDSHAEWSAIRIVIWGAIGIDPAYDAGEITARTVLGYYSNDLSINAGETIRWDQFNLAELHPLPQYPNLRGKATIRSRRHSA